MSIPAFVTESEEVIRPEQLRRPHPGSIFKRRFIEGTSLTRPEVAAILDVSTKHLSRFINEHVHIGVELARKLEACTNLSAHAWLHYQTQYDLYENAKRPARDNLIRYRDPAVKHTCKQRSPVAYA
ncbi:MAG: HigA family addiction module antitoxin [Thalassotalea sp.]